MHLKNKMTQIFHMGTKYGYTVFYFCLSYSRMQLTHNLFIFILK